MALYLPFLYTPSLLGEGPFYLIVVIIIIITMSIMPAHKTPIEEVFCTCYKILICLVCFVASLKLSFG